ncbi:MAG: hypothetical protein KIT16_03170 [Rhodospirillaceae bacterium]|nr:hypothetical protein [Rhodospirillaceae bacterium]
MSVDLTSPMHKAKSEGTFAAWFDGLRARIAAAREDARVRADLEHELACLDQAGELDGVLDSLGLSRGAVDFLIENYPGSARRFEAMAERLGVAGQVGPVAAIDALSSPRRRCLFCEEVRQCEHWLKDGQTEGYEKFCPNAGTFDALRAKG